MKILGFTITRDTTSAPTAPVKRSMSPEALAWLRHSEVPPPTPLLYPYQQVVWIYRAINVLAEQVANIPFLLSSGQRGRENLITSGPLVDFYERPAPNLNRFQYWELRIIWLMLRGECFRIPLYQSPDSGVSTIKTQNSKLKNILILDPAHFQHIIKNNELVGWLYKPAGDSSPLKEQTLLPEEVWHEKLPNPYSHWRGLSPLLVADLAAKTNLAAASFMRGFLENNADNGLIVRTNEQLDDDQRAQIYAALRNRKRHGCADTPLLLWSSAEIIQPGLSSADLQFLENRKFSRAEICSAFGVPEEIVATTDYNKYDVMQGARLNFIENRVAPLCARLEAEENATTIPALNSPALYPGRTPETPVGWFDLDSLPIMQEARRARLAAAKVGFDMGIPFNELNRVLDLGFKPLPWGSVGYLPSKYRPLPRIPEDPLNNPNRYRHWQS